MEKAINNEDEAAESDHGDEENTELLTIVANLMENHVRDVGNTIVFIEQMRP